MITKSSKKAYRQTLRRREKNSAQKSALKKVLKNYKKLVAREKSEEAQKELPGVYKALDKAAKVNVLKKNTASRLKSRLTAMLNKKSSAK